MEDAKEGDASVMGVFGVGVETSKEGNEYGAVDGAAGVGEIEIAG